MARRRRVVSSESAASSLSEAVECFAQRSPISGERFLSAVESAAVLFITLVHRGRFARDLPGMPIRESFVRRYRLMYLIGHDVVLIIAFVHGARDIRHR